MNKMAKIFIAGHRGMVGSAIVRVLSQQGFSHLLLRSHDELDLTNQQAVRDFFAQETPDYVVLAAAKVGEIRPNENYPAEFIYTNVIHQAYKAAVQQLLFLGGSVFTLNLQSSHINIGTDVLIKELVELIQNIVGYRGDIVWDTSKPDGTPKKLLNVGKLEKLGWVASIELKAGLEQTYQNYLATL